MSLLRANKRLCHGRLLDENHCAIRDPLGERSQPYHLDADCPRDSSPTSTVPPDSPSSTASSSSALPLTRVNANNRRLAAQQNIVTEGLMRASSSPSSSISYEGVYASGNGFGAELQTGGKRLRQDGFCSPLEAALERTQWLRGLQQGKERAPASSTTSPPVEAAAGSPDELSAVRVRVRGVPTTARAKRRAKPPTERPAVAAQGREQLAAEALVNLVGHRGECTSLSSLVPSLLSLVAPAVTRPFTYAEEASAHSRHGEMRNTSSSSAANTYRGVEQPGRAASAQVIPAKLMLNQERGQRAAGAAQVIPQQAAAPAGSSTASTLEARFAAHVMCNYTPRPPDKLSKKRWVSCDDLHRQLEPRTPSEAERWHPTYVKQLVTELFKDHPLFAGRPFSEWSKKLMNRDALAHSTGKTHVTYFCLEHTPTASRRC